MRTIGTVFIALLITFGTWGSVAHAQNAEMDQLRVTIKERIMSDPRSASLTSDQVQAMVNALSAQALQQGVTAQQLLSHPLMPDTVGDAEVSCSGIAIFSCAYQKVSDMFGTVGVVFAALFVAAVLFLFVYSLMRQHNHPLVTGVEQQ